ncbi:MAG TPA: ChaN family lipoprotein [Rhodocyclaceae bacterium]|nr:ChaN family lipoprotein [Rhodocyclaceae bacterium]
MRLVLCLTTLLLIAGCAAPRLVQTDHPLAGRIWDVSQRRFLSPQEAEDRIAAADIALLGETHDNPAHHQIQTQLLHRLVDQGKQPALAMEQFDTDWQTAMDDARRVGGTAAAVAKAGNISSGWEWPLYRPLVTVALKEQLPLVAANLARSRTRSIAGGGLAALGKGEPERLGLNQPWSADQNATLRGMLVAGHCGDDNPMIDKLIDVQRAKDAVMADRILAGGRESVAIIGRAHARQDIGVPLYLKARAPGKRVVSVGLVEVAADLTQAEDYPDAAPGTHDILWFTPSSLRPDPCAGYKKLGH